MNPDLAPGYIVESPAVDRGGVRRGTFRVCVGTEARARALAAEVPGRTWCEVPLDELRPVERENLLRARRERA